MQADNLAYARKLGNMCRDERGKKGKRGKKGEGKGGKRNTCMLHNDNTYDSLSPINMKPVYSPHNILMIYSIELNEVVILVNPICFLMLFHDLIDVII